MSDVPVLKSLRSSPLPKAVALLRRLGPRSGRAPSGTHLSGTVLPDRPASASRWSRAVGVAERHTLPLLGAFSGVYLALMLHFAPRRPMWIDEYLTFYLARLPLPDLWSALSTGAESHPPTFLLLTGASMKLFGSDLFGLRLPAILGFLLAELCLFQFARRRSSFLVATIPMLVQFTTRATSYAMEARGYGLLLGFTALALVCWQAATGKRRRPGVVPSPWGQPY